MEKPLSPIFDDAGTEVSRDAYWGQKELGAAIGTTPAYAGTLLRLVGLLESETKEPTGEALRTGAAKHVTVATADGPHRYPRWRKDLVLGVLSQALQDNPKPLTRSELEKRRHGASYYSRPQSPEGPQSPEEKIVELERRIELLEKRLVAVSGPL
ncbi:hypothetical protein ACIQTZ_19065 [Paenarthrobacter sp. NPDC090520]|uniref:hypothetical protein n=1 Tax=Paenarthrobacter sp. NPDC090520 TaxID=3364382 RepID=UPI00380E74F9